MRHVEIRASGALEDFLPAGSAGRSITVTIELPTGVRDVVQSVGIPHVEVGALLVNGAVADWDLVVGGGSRIELTPRYPLEAPPDDTRFLLDVHLGRLARYLRLLGIDAAHGIETDDDELCARAATGFILLTRDRGLLQRAALRHGSFVRATDPRTQTTEILDRFCLRRVVRPFTRCLACNGLLRPADPDAVEVPAGVKARHTEFTRCPKCARVYWQGTHYQRLARLAEQLLAPAEAEESTKAGE